MQSRQTKGVDTLVLMLERWDVENVVEVAARALYRMRVEISCTRRSFIRLSYSWEVYIYSHLTLPTHNAATALARRLRLGAGCSVDEPPPPPSDDEPPPPPAVGPGCWAMSLAFATAVATTRSKSSSCSCMRRFRARFGKIVVWSGSRVSGLTPLPSWSTERMADRSYEWPSDATTGSAVQVVQAEAPAPG